MIAIIFNLNGGLLTTILNILLICCIISYSQITLSVCLSVFTSHIKPVPHKSGFID